MAEQKLYLFGDQTYDVQPHLKELMRHRDNPVLEDFLTKAYDAIRRELYRLPVETRDDLPRFTSLDDLLLWKQDSKRCVALDMAVTCVYQLGTFISQKNTWDIQASNSRILGICTGALAAAAVSCSRSTIELVAPAVEAVIVAFRTGLHVTDMARRIEPSDSLDDKSWSVIVPGAASADAVSRFCETTKLPLSARPYVSAYAPNGVTVSGPPRSLLRFTNPESSDTFTFKTIPIYAPYHAPHLYTSEDVDEIIGTLALRDASLNVPVFSGAGITVESDSFEKLLRAAVEQILLESIRWNDIVRELQAHLQKEQPRSFSVVAIGTKADQLIYTALRQTSLKALLPSISPAVQSQPSITGDGSYPNPGKAKLAIIGMSGRFPGARDNEEFWNVLHEGLDMHKEVPPLHWDVKTHVDPAGARKNTSITPFGCWLDDPASFDARFFNISPREAPQIDPAQRIALMTAYEAIEQAGIVPDATPSTRRDRVGLFYGVTSQDWFETNSAQNVDTYFIPGGNMAFIPGRINYFFKFSGPSFAVNTACSSSLAGIHLACNSLWRGDIDTAIAGGTNILTNPDMTAGLDKGHFLSRTGNCKTFDDSADGYCRGEGVGTIILKRLDDAIADKDPILGVILGAYTNHSAESESITRPHVGAQRAVFNKILNQAAVDPYSIGYVEMHGTGTQAGDAGEMSSVLDTFAPHPGQVKRGKRTSEEALFLGSAKANIGHGEAASGMASIIKVLLMMKKNIIVPHCGIKTKINHRFPTDLQERNVNIALKPTSWQRSADPTKPRRAFINNFSAAGGNTALLIEDAPLIPEPANQAPDSRSHHVVAISAKNGISLQGNLRSLLAFLKQSPDVSLGRLSYTTTARRIHHQHRVMLTGASSEELCNQIDTALRDQAGMTRPKGSPQVVFTFTGQGAQYPGMGKELYESFSLFRTELRRLDRIGQKLGFPSVLPVIENQSGEQDIGLFNPVTVQLASTCMQIALAKLWASWNVSPVAVVGHSLGEYAALNVAGVMSDADTIYLVGTRASLLVEKCTRDTHSMLVIKAAVDEIEKVIGDKNIAYEVACINSPIESVITGINSDIASLRTILTDAGMKTTLLKVPYAFHSSQVDPVLEDFKTIAGNVTYSEAKIPVLCPLDGSIVVGIGAFGPEYLARHTREPVNMRHALLTANSHHILPEKGFTLEVGPHPAISGMVKAVLGAQVTCLASAQRGRPAFQMLAAALKTLYISGADIRWPAYHDDFKSSQKVIEMPAYNWDLKPYWIQYVNDWSLRKGDAPITIVQGPSRLESTTIHHVVEETGDSNKARIVVESDVTRKDFRPLVEGHEVDGVPLCTPAVYADIALSLGQHLLDRHHPNKTGNTSLEIADMTILKALILQANSATEQVLQVHAEADWSSNSAAIKFMTYDSRKKLQEHSHCVVRFNDGSLQKKLQKETVAKQKQRALRDGILSGETARFNRAMVYRAIRPLARFHEEYRAVDEIVLNSKTLEASSRLSFKDFHKEGTFHTHPGLIDGLTWAAGFSMNCNDNNDLDKDVFVNHGWGSFQIFEPMDFTKEYTTYSHMIEGKDRLWQGEVTILDGDKVVAHLGQFAMQGVPRRILRVILSIEGGNKAKQPPQPPAHKKEIAAQVSIQPQTETRARSKDNSSSSPAVARAMAIIAEESGLAPADLTDGTVFGDVGIDSLLGLTISARFKEELDLDLDFNALFYEYPTVADLKGFLGDSKTSSSTEAPSSGSSDTEETKATSSLPDEKPPAVSNVQIERAIQIISEESGVATEDLTDDSNFADCGVDSLLSLVIVSRFRDELELDIQHESLFLECPTVADLKQMLGGTVQPVEELPAPAPISVPETKTVTPAPIKADTAALAARQKAVDEYVEKYTAGFTAPIPSTSPTAHYNENAKVVLVTGTTGSLGGHLVFKLAHRPDVQTIICLNREHKTEAFTRQKKAMKDKGVHFPEHLLSKLHVLQGDTSKPLLGLSADEYEGLAGSVTHIIHQAWPMSVKRTLEGFEPQFAVVRNLIDLASTVVARHAAGFRFGFQLVSSISVVGNYPGRVVPEERVGIEALLPIGYAEAKWGCERMLDRTVHRHPERFRAMTVRLGQIAGSKVSGYWNPMEHFGFIVKSSQTLNALPDVAGTAYWTPVNDIAGALADLNLAAHAQPCYPVYHIDNPVGQPWKELNPILADALGIPPQNLVPLEEWTRRVRAAPQRNNPASALVDFLDTNYERMSCGGLVLDPSKAVEHSPTLAAVGPVSEEVVRKYIYVWKEIGFLE
ncbi:ketoacyl-synt-domain-containing protein [Durotheca rogersii]|uniref:ketoacyl-synt-domain-containing protein n=1 Tax=Durotheca rogersii TaxID=419775 RepID=UPI00221E7B31|nr:ketoacyl-synt-domain-containing protein [Durotheca rogersii]KAI5855057.1 ketoacyl-synt-domain-containing protein [Durotheca rogersii]